jgi:hypothetical protein
MRVTKAGCGWAGSCVSLAIALSLSSSVAYAGWGVWTSGVFRSADPDAVHHSSLSVHGGER